MKRRLTTLGKILLISLVGLVVTALGDNGYKAFKLKSLVSKPLTSAESYASSISVSDVNHHGSLIRSKGSATLTITAGCKTTPEHRFDLSYAVTHIPFFSDLVTLTLTPVSHSDGPFLGAKNNPLDTLTLDGKISNEGVLHLSSKAQSFNIELVDGNQMHIEDGVLTLSVDKDQWAFDLSSKDVALTGSNGPSSLVNMKLTVNSNSYRDEFFKVGVEAEKFKSQNLFARQLKFDGDITKGDGKYVSKLVFSSQAASMMGSTVENPRFELTGYLNDADAFKKVKTVIESGCDAHKMDEEERLDQSLQTSRLFESGFGLMLNSATWSGPRGVVSGSMKGAFNKVLDLSSGFPDVKKGFKVSGEWVFSKGYSGTDFIDNLVGSGALKPDGDTLKGRLSYGVDGFIVNGKKDIDSTSETISTLREFFSGIPQVVSSFFLIPTKN